MLLLLRLVVAEDGDDATDGVTLTVVDEAGGLYVAGATGFISM